MIGIIGSFQVFTQIFVMTSGGPVDRTTTMVFYIYESAFKFYEMGYASTLAFVALPHAARVHRRCSCGSTGGPTP